MTTQEQTYWNGEYGDAELHAQADVGDRLLEARERWVRRAVEQISRQLINYAFAPQRARFFAWLGIPAMIHHDADQGESDQV